MCYTERHRKTYGKGVEMKRISCKLKRIEILVVCGIVLLGATGCRQGKNESMKTQSPVTEAFVDESVADTDETLEEIVSEGHETAEETVIEESTTEESTTEEPVTEVPVTEEPTTEEPTTEAPTKEVPVARSISAKVKGSYYIGDTLSASDFSISVTMSDGSIRKNPAGWSADKLYLDGVENTITVTYQGIGITITVNASERPEETQAPTTQAPDEAPAQPPAQEVGPSNGMELRRSAAEEAFRIQNDLIVQHGGTPLQWSETFYQQACQRAKEIVTNFSHDGFYNTTAYAENIAMGSYDANVMVQAWYHSEGHRNNMLHGWNYGAIACYGDYWVALFGPNAD